MSDKHTSNSDKNTQTEVKKKTKPRYKKHRTPLKDKKKHDTIYQKTRNSKNIHLRRRTQYDNEQYNDSLKDETIDEEGLTLKDRQEILNKTHPFGLPLWKPALYKKSRSITRKAKTALHAIPTSRYYITPGNILWSVMFGWWLYLITFIMGILLSCIPNGGGIYANLMFNLGWYLFWPFGKYVQKVPLASFNNYHVSTQHPEQERLLESELNNIIIDVKHANMIKIYNKHKNRSLGKFFFYTLFYSVFVPLVFIVAALCWLSVFMLPMGKLNFTLIKKLRKIPLQLYFGKGSVISKIKVNKQHANNSNDLEIQPSFEQPVDTLNKSEEGINKNNASVILCIYNAMGIQYLKYTYDGINILFINLLIVVVLVLGNSYLIEPYFLGGKQLVSSMTIFGGCLVSTIPLAYLIGMSVSSISAQSSLGLGAVINATFGSIVEILLYSFALVEGKSKLVGGSVVGSFLAGMLLMPGVSMISGAFKKKQQKFNAKSAGVTSTMLIMSIIGVFTPTIFYQIYGTFEISCMPCKKESIIDAVQAKCQRCMFQPTNPLHSSIYNTNVKPLMYICAALLPTAYVICLWFTLKTHTKHIYEKKPKKYNKGAIKSLYSKLANIHLLDQILPNIDLVHNSSNTLLAHENSNSDTNSNNNKLQSQQNPNSNLSNNFQRHYSIEAAQPKNNNSSSPPLYRPLIRIVTTDSQTQNKITGINDNDVRLEDLKTKYDDSDSDESDEEAGGHDAPEWSKLKSSFVLFACTVLFAMVAELMVSSVDTVIEKFGVGEKILGITLFALVPNVTEFSNAILFALYGNISLSMEIGSAYSVQVSLLQIPAVVAVSAWLNSTSKKLIIEKTFTLIFPKLDMIMVLFSVFLLTYIYIEGNANYFKGSILVITYLVAIASFFYEPSFTDSAGFFVFV